MLYLDVRFGQMHVHLGDIECGMSKDESQRHHITTVHQVTNSECVPEEVRVEALADNGDVVLRVLDRGPGVPANERERIFEAFQRGANEKSGGGSGLGLALVDAYAKAHDGRIEVGDREGGGAVFALRLPAA